MDIVLAGYVALEECLRVTREKKESLMARFPQVFLKRLFDMEGALNSSNIEKALETLDLSCVFLGKGGLYRGLWELGDTFDTGINVYLKDVKVLQEVVELTEYIGINPYTADSLGGVLIRTDKGEELTEGLLALGIDSCVIGKTTKSNDRVVFYDENVLYLTPYKEEK